MPENPDKLKGIALRTLVGVAAPKADANTNKGGEFLGIVSSDLNNDPAYKALAELQSLMLVDRGPFIEGLVKKKKVSLERFGRETPIVFNQFKIQNNSKF